MRRPWIVVLVALLVLALVAVVAHRPLLRAAGRILVVEPSDGPADAIVVVAGSTPTREALAATLFREGRAPVVVVSRQTMPVRVQQLLDLGIRPLDFQGESVAALEKYGVPRAAIVTLTEPVEITEMELRAVAAEARARGWRRVLLVTTPNHSRRVRLVWHREAGPGIEAGIAMIDDECSADRAWWTRRRCSEAVLHEYLGLIAVYLHVSSLMR
ncbi:MAG TPA: ElyC/SanA/YdcF family protein [Methylomirabilota bacterium]